MNVVDRLIQLFANKGQGTYFGEAVTELEHALQTAQRAEQAGANNELIAAALLHDVGHLLHGLGEDVAEKGIDAQHEEGGADWLQRYFGPAISEPVRHHVAAKRYLCAIDPTYRAGLSAASRLSLQLQGGPFSPDEVRQFEQGPFWQDAVALRRWDDEAKVPNLIVPGLEHYRACLLSVLLTAEAE